MMPTPIKALMCVSALATVRAVPLQLTIAPREAECWYEKVDAGEQLTLSVYILSGNEMRCTMLLEGPVAPVNATKAEELHYYVHEYLEGRAAYGILTSAFEVLDFEHFRGDEGIQEFDDDDDDFGFIGVDDEVDITDEERSRRVEEARRRIQLSHQRAAAERQRHEEARKANTQREDGEPVSKTIHVRTDGWYRACVRGATSTPVQVQMDMRKSSEFGYDNSTGHVMTWEKRDEMARMISVLQERFQNVEEEDGIKEEDFDSVKKRVSDLRRVLTDIQIKQGSARNRMTSHHTINQHSHSHMVSLSIMQTAVLIAVTGYQVFTIRRWFTGPQTLLGR